MADTPQEEVTTDPPPIKPYTDNVYAATPSSGSGGDGGDEADEQEQPQKASIPEFLQTASADTTKTKIVSEWLNQASNYSTENPLTEQDEEVSASACKGESTDKDETVPEDISDPMKADPLEDENLPTTFKIFVSNLPPGLFNSELMELFDQYGEVVECEIFAKNYAFVHMTSEESGVKALEALNGYELRGCRINVKRSVNKTNNPAGKPQQEDTGGLEPGVEIGTYKLYVGKVPDITKEFVEKLLEPYGRTVEVEIFRNFSAFVHMETEEGGKKAIEELNGKTIPESEQPLIVSESKNPEGPSLATIKLKVKNLASTVTAEEVRDLFTPYGLVLKVSLAAKPSSSTHRTAIVHLEQFGNIRSAIKDLTGKEVGGSEIKVEATFDKPSPVKPKHNPIIPSSNRSQQQGSEHPYGSWQPADTPSFRPSSSFAHPHPQDWGPPNKMRLIPMPSKADLQKLPRSGLHGRRLLRPDVPPPPLMFQQPFEYQQRRMWGRNNDYNNEYDNAYGYNQPHNDGFGGGYSNYEETEEYNNEYEVYDWSQHGGGNDYAPPPMKIPRVNPWTNPQNFAGRQNKQNGKKSWNNHANNNSNGGNNNKGKRNPFPQLPTADRFPKGRPPPSLMSFNAPNPESNDWSADLPVSNFSTDFSRDQDFSSDEPVTNTMNAVPFDYSNMKRKGNHAQNRQQWNSNPNPPAFGNSKGNNKSGKSGKARKGKARHPGLGTAQQQKKTAQQTGNDEALYDNSAAKPDEWQQVSSSSLGQSTTAHEAANSYAQFYSQQTWPSFSKGNQNKYGNKRPTPKQIKDAEEEQKRQYAEYLKQKPWLYQAIPGTVKKVQQ